MWEHHRLVYKDLVSGGCVPPFSYAGMMHSTAHFSRFRHGTLSNSDLLVIMGIVVMVKCYEPPSTVIKVANKLLQTAVAIHCAEIVP